MSILQRSFVTAAVAVLLTLAVHYTIRASHLKEASRLREANDRIRFEISQKRRSLIPHESSHISARVAPNGTNAEKSDRVSSADASTVARRESTGDYRREGQGTPVATLQTFAWACDRGDLAAMQQLIVFDAAARTKAVAHFASVPENVRSQWASAEAMAAALLISGGINHPFPIAGILAQAKTQQLTVDRVVLHLPDTSREHSEYQKTPEGWKYVITEAMVDGYLSRAVQEAAAR